MKPYVIFHPLVQRDLREILDYYEAEASENLANQYYSIFMQAVEKALAHPQKHHYLREPLRLANLSKFPYHFLYRETTYGIRVLVLRHHKRHPSYGMRRK